MDNITDQLIVEKQDGVGRIGFDNQARRNALTYEMWCGIPVVLRDFLADDAVRVIILHGTGGKAFSAGADISQFEKNRSSEDAIVEYNRAVSEALGVLLDAEKPTIAMIEGYCIGGGMGVASCCDLRLCNEEARFAVPAAKLGLGYRLDGLKPLIDIVGPSRAKEILFTARQFTATEAYDMGLVNRVLPRNVLAAYVDDYARTISANAPLTVKAAKVVIQEATRLDAADIARCEKAVADCFASEDYKEGRKAFAEKRKPAFQGR